MHPDTILRVAFYLRARTLTLAAEQAARLQAVADSAPSWRVVAVFCDIDPGPDLLAVTADGGLVVQPIAALDGEQDTLPALLDDEPSTAKMSGEG